MNNHDHSQDMNPDEAAAHLGVDLKGLAPLLERYGVGRYNEPRTGNQFVYARSDIEKVKRHLGADVPS